MIGGMGMSRFDNISGMAQKVFGRIVNETKPVETNKAAVEKNSSKSMADRKLKEVKEILIAQEKVVESLTRTVMANEEKINQIYDQIIGQKDTFDNVQNTISQQEGIMAKQIESLKEDNKQCMTQLKETILSQEGTDTEKLDAMMKEAIKDLLSLQQAQTKEVNRAIMSVKTEVGSIHGNVTETINKQLKEYSKVGSSTRIWILIIAILNFLGLVGYIVYDNLTNLI